MHIIELSEKNLTNKIKPKIRPILLIGNFDGVHLGHQYLIKQAKKIAKSQNIPIAVMSFSPHPKYYFQKKIAGFSIISENQKQNLLKKLGIDYFYNVIFDEFTASTLAKDFIDNFLVGAVNPSHIIVGSNFYFGRGRAGDVEFLKKELKKYKVKVNISNLFKQGKATISSSNIREKLKLGDIDAVNNMLGWNWFLEAELLKKNTKEQRLELKYTDNKIIKIAKGKYKSKITLENNKKYIVFSWHDDSDCIKILPQDKGLLKNCNSNSGKISLYPLKFLEPL